MYYDVLIRNGWSFGLLTALNPYPDFVETFEETHKDAHIFSDITVNKETHSNTVKTANRVPTSTEVQAHENKVNKILNDKVLSIEISYTK